MFTRSNGFMFCLWFALSSIIPAGAQQPSCPTNIPDNSTLAQSGTPKVVTTFAPGANITVYIDANYITQNAGSMYSGITQALDAWNVYQQSTGGSVTYQSVYITGSNGTATSIPNGTAANPTYVIQYGPVPSPPGGLQKDAGSAWTVDQTSGFVSNVQTNFDPTWATAADGDPMMAPFIAGLESHEFAQPFGFGDCDPN